MERDDRVARERVETVKDDVRDGADEIKGRFEAGTERTKRLLGGDAMPLSDHVASHANELKHDLKADFDKAKRTMRDASTE